MKGFDFDVTKAEQIFDLLLKEKQLKLPEKSTSTSISCAIDTNRKKMSMSTAQGGHWGDARLYATTSIARSSGTVGIPA